MSRVAVKKTREEICFDRLGKVVVTSEYPTKEAVFRRLMEADPEHGKNCSWIFDQYKAGFFFLEDVGRVREDIEIFLKNSRVLQKKLANFSYPELKIVLQQFQLTLSHEIISEDPDIKILYKGEYGQLLVPLTVEASCKVGSGTKWCTAAKKENMFIKYSEKAPLYVWIDYKRGKKKYQFHFDLDTPEFMFMDELDNPIDDDLLNYYRTHHPIVSELFKEREQEILGDPMASYMYSADVLKRRWLEAEPIIMTDSFAAYRYAYRVLKRRWIEAEPIIMSEPDDLVEYILVVVKGRWIEAERFIKKSERATYLYAKNILKRRWVEAEPYINKYPQYRNFVESIRR
jgi:hypothetical protein